MKLNIGYVGLSHLGINYAIATAMKGFKIICYDKNLEIISKLKKKKIPFYEKDAQTNLKKKFKNFTFTNKIDDLKNCDLVFISQDVPTNNNGRSNILEIKKLISNTIKILKKRCNLIILCQVPPGFTRTIKWPLPNLYYQVETLIFSDAIQRALFPERIIIGKSNKFIDKKFKFFLKKFKCPILEMNYESAELAKISINIFLISSVTNTNILSEISERIGAKWSDVSSSIKLDRRIGKHAYLNPGLGISGGNLERDLKTVDNFLRFNKIYKNYFKLINKISFHRKDWNYKNFQNFSKKFKNLKRVGILGLTYKENTNSLKNSPSIYFIKKISLLRGFKIFAFDPKIKKLSKYENVNICKSINELIQNSEILLVLTPWEIFKKINLRYSKNIKIIIDPYKILKISKIKKNIKLVTMGS